MRQRVAAYLLGEGALGDVAWVCAQLPCDHFRDGAWLGAVPYPELEHRELLHFLAVAQLVPCYPRGLHYFCFFVVGCYHCDGAAARGALLSHVLGRELHFLLELELALPAALLLALLLQLPRCARRRALLVYRHRLEFRGGARVSCDADAGLAFCCEARELAHPSVEVCPLALQPVDLDHQADVHLAVCVLGPLVLGPLVVRLVFRDHRVL